MTRALQRALADACFGVEAGEAIARDLPGFLASHGVAPDDIAAIVAAPRRLAIYRSLVRNGLSAVVLRMLPRTRARMNAACAGRFDADMATFVADVGPRTHHLRDVPSELFAWAEPRWRSDARVPEYLPDLAAYELAHFAVASADSSRPTSTATRHPGPTGDVADVALDRPLAFAASVRLVRYAWAVHELSADDDVFDEPARRDVRLLAYRDAAHAVRWLELTPFAGALLARLVDGESLGRGVEATRLDCGLHADGVLAEVAHLLADLAARGVVVGGTE